MAKKERKRLYNKLYRDSHKEERKKYLKDHAEKIFIQKKAHREKNKEKELKQARAYKEAHKEELRVKAKVYRDKHKEKTNVINKAYRAIHKDKANVLNKTYKKTHRQEIREYEKLYKKKNPLYKLACNIRGSIRASLKSKGYKKTSKTNKITGCSFEFLQNFLESKFEPWMNWENHGKYNGEHNFGWDIDHIQPISSAKTEEDIIRLNHYSNLQPLCSYINRVIKRDNVL